MSIKEVDPSFTVMHLRRNIIVLMAEFYHLIFTPMGLKNLRFNYGHPDKSHNGPFSPKTYLLDQLKKSTWGDELVILGVSIIWNLKITTLYAASLKANNYRFEGMMENADVILVYNEAGHFSGTGNLQKVSK